MPNGPWEHLVDAIRSPEAIGVGSGVLAAAVRVINYSGPPRPRSVAMCDALATIALGFLGFEGALWYTSNDHAALAVGGIVGVLGWNEIKRWAWTLRVKIGGSDGP